MKKVTLALGYLSVVCIAIYAANKVMHWPGANIAAIAGAVLFSILYAPLLYADRLKSADTMVKKVFHLVVLATMVFFGGAFLAHALHLPGKMALSCIAYTLLVIVILMQIIRGFTEENTDPVDRHHVASLSAIVMILFVFYEVTMISKSSMDNFEQNIATQRMEIQFFTNKTNALFENLDKTTGIPAIQEYYKKAEEVRSQSDSLVAYIRGLGESMMFMADEKKVSFDSTENLCRKSNARVGDEFMVEQNNDSIFRLKIKNYADFIAGNTNSRGKEILDMFFAQQDSTSGPVCCAEYCCGHCYCKPLVSVLIDLHADILHIRMLESETINYLQTMQAKVPKP